VAAYSFLTANIPTSKVIKRDGVYVRGFHLTEVLVLVYFEICIMGYNTVQYITPISKWSSKLQYI